MGLEKSDNFENFYVDSTTNTNETQLQHTWQTDGTLTVGNKKEKESCEKLIIFQSGSKKEKKPPKQTYSTRSSWGSCGIDPMSALQWARCYAHHHAARK
jgi:hypothetical protein